MLSSCLQAELMGIVNGDSEQSKVGYTFAEMAPAMTRGKYLQRTPFATTRNNINHTILANRFYRVDKFRLSRVDYLANVEQKREGRELVARGVLGEVEQISRHT